MAQQIGMNQFQQPFQPLSGQFTPPKPYEQAVKETAELGNKDSVTRQLVSTLSNQARYPLQLETLFWNKYSKLRKKAHGGCVTDQTLLINNTRMPFIRKPNYTESTWNVNINLIPVTLPANTKPADSTSTTSTKQQPISLRDYLAHFDDYITRKPSTSTSSSSSTADDSKERDTNKPAIANLLSADRDNTVLMNTQACFLPIDQSADSTSFSLATLNWKTGLRNPACLYIVSTMYGTSAVVIEGNFQKVLFNNHGKNDLFTFRNEDLLSDVNQCITIVQVPLKQKSRKQIEQEQATSSSWGITNWWSGSGGERKKRRVFDVLPTNCKDIKVQQLLKEYGYHEECAEDADKSEANKPKVSRSGIKIVPSTVPTYCCTRELSKGEAQSCYGEKNANITVSCDGCGESYSGEQIIWHSPETIEELHPNGYDLCDKCAQKHVQFDEFRGLSGLKRDDRYSIRVTLLYYKPVINGVLNEQMLNEVIQKLMRIESLGRMGTPQQPPPPAVPPSPSSSMGVPQQIQPAAMPYMQSQAVSMKPAVNIPKVAVRLQDYEEITNALKELQLSGEYVKVFQNENVTDWDLVLLNEQDLSVLFPALGPRVRFRAWLKRNLGKLKAAKKQMEQNKVDVSEYRMIGNVFRSLGVANNGERFVANFMHFGVTDKMLDALLFGGEKDLETLIPEMSVRVMFRAYLMKQQQQKAAAMMMNSSVSNQNQAQVSTPSMVATGAAAAGAQRQQFLF